MYHPMYECTLTTHGSFVAVLDAPGDKHYLIAKIMPTYETTTRSHYHSTYDVRHPTVKHNVESIAYQLSHTNQVFMR